MESWLPGTSPPLRRCALGERCVLLPGLFRTQPDPGFVPRPGALRGIHRELTRLAEHAKEKADDEQR